MIAHDDSARHEEAWLSLPWLANGRISQAEREKIEPHVRACAVCREELAFQRLLCNTLTEPDRVTYAPGPSFRKLMDRIDGNSSAPTASAPAPVGLKEGTRSKTKSAIPLWRPPGLAWAASFALLVGLAGVMFSANRTAAPLYKTHTDAPTASANVLHIAFDRKVTVGEAEEALRSAGARIVEGPDTTGIFGVVPESAASQNLGVLSARLRADPRVRLVTPLPNNQ
jgi:hypothetical protein